MCNGLKPAGIYISFNRLPASLFVVVETYSLSLGFRKLTYLGKICTKYLRFNLTGQIPRQNAPVDKFTQKSINSHIQKLHFSRIFSVTAWYIVVDEISLWGNLEITCQWKFVTLRELQLAFISHKYTWWQKNRISLQNNPKFSFSILWELPVSGGNTTAVCAQKIHGSSRHKNTPCIPPPVMKVTHTFFVTGE